MSVSSVGEGRLKTKSFHVEASTIHLLHTTENTQQRYTKRNTVLRLINVKKKNMQNKGSTKHNKPSIHSFLPHLACTAWRQVGKTPTCRDGRVEDHIARLSGDLRPIRVQPGLLHAKAELFVAVPVHISVGSGLPLRGDVKNENRGERGKKEKRN